MKGLIDMARQHANLVTEWGYILPDCHERRVNYEILKNQVDAERMGGHKHTNKMLVLRLVEIVVLTDRENAQDE